MSTWATSYPRNVANRQVNDVTPSTSVIAGDVTGSLGAAVVGKALNGAYLFAGSAANQSLGFTGPAAMLNTVATNYNHGFGYGVLQALTTGVRNTAFGRSALAGCTTGTDNTAFGGTALAAVTTGVQHTAFGYGALSAQTTGGGSCAFGYNAGKLNIANQCMFFGAECAPAATAATGTYFGFKSAYSLTTGSENATLGNSALYSTTTGYYHTAVGESAGYSFTTANGNTCIGHNAAYLQTAGNDSVFVGHQAGLGRVSGNQNIYVGNQSAADSAHTGANNIVIGYNAKLGTTTATAGNLIIGNALSRPNVAFPVFMVDLAAVPTYADDAAAGVGGLTAGCIYKTATGVMGIKL